MLNWIQRFGIFCVLDHCGDTHTGHHFPLIAAAGATRIFEGKTGSCFATLQEAVRTGEWLFGHIGYDCKNETETLVSQRPDHIGFPHLFFFQPEIIIWLNETEIQVSSIHLTPDEILQQVMSADAAVSEPVPADKPQLQGRFTKEEYTDTINRLKKHIQRGDCYEINFCQEFFAENAVIDPLAAYRSLTVVSPNPFSAFYRINNRYLICASPERFLQKKGGQLLSQPIKGTLKRSFASPGSDEVEKKILQQNPKERSENIMVADLVRNDLSKVCIAGSVSVTELCGTYSFPQVHHLVSTITGTAIPGVPVHEIIKALFPMGSMTGAPKKKVMELIEQYEKTRRGIFSGAVGYISPEKDFDFNVVIRSMMYNSSNRYLSYQVGSGITFYCDAAQEYEECSLKAAAIEKILFPAG
jgi:para-aminobenzoate synthetase component I